MLDPRDEVGPPGTRSEPVPPRGRGHWLFLITHTAPGGTWEVLDMLRRDFERRGIDVTVVAFYRGAGHAPARGVDATLLPGDRIGPRDAFGLVLRLLRLLIAIRPTAVLSFMPAANVLGALLALMAGVPRRFPTQHQPAPTLSPWLRLPDRWLGTLGVYTRILTVARSIETSFADHPAAYRRRIRVIPNALAPIAACEERATVRRRLGVAEGAVLAVALGRLSWEKNALTTVVAASQVPALSLVLVGDGPQRAEIETFVATCGLGSRIALVGHRSRQEAIDILFAADVFVQLSHFEGRSLALLEAVGAGKAVVASDIPAQREVLTLPDGRVAGLLCDPDDVEAIAEALRAVTSDGALRARLASLAAQAGGVQDPTRMGDAYADLAA